MKNTLISFTILILASSQLIAQKINVQNLHKVDLDATGIVTESFFRSGFALDNEGNKIIVGGFDGENVAFDPSNQITSNGNKNIFIAKYDSNNAILWLKNIGGIEVSASWGISGTNAHDAATSVKVDKSNNIYVLTTTNLSSKETVDFDPGHPNTNSILNNGLNGKEIVFAKYSPDGELLWVKVVGDEFSDTALNMILDSNNNIWITGTIGGFTLNDIDFDKDKAHPNGEDILPGQFRHLGFFACYNSDGEFILVKGIGSGLFPNLNVQVAESGNIYAAGSFNGTDVELFLGGTNPQLISSKGSYEFSPQNEDAFLMKFTTAGEIQWVKTISNSSYSCVSSLLVDKDENLYVTGWFNGAIDFDQEHNFDFDTKTSASDGSGYIAKYSPNGELKWVNLVEGGTSSRIRMARLCNDYLVICGNYFGNNVRFGDTINNSDAQPDAFISTMGINGEWIDTHFFSSADYCTITDIDISLAGAIHFLGFNADLYEGSVDATKMFFGESQNKTLSVDNAGNLTNLLSIYPNPTKDKLIIEAIEDIEEIKLYNLHGECLLTRKRVSTVDIRDLPEGVYLLKIKNNNGKVQNHKIIKE